MLATSATLPFEMLRAAESAARAKEGSQVEPVLIQTTSIDKLPIKTSIGFSLLPDTKLEDVGDSDIIYLPALWRNPRPIVKKHPEILAWLRKAYENGAMLSAVGTGCCFLAEAGLLNDKPATTHWHYFDQFQRDYPRVKLKRQYFITQASNLYCSASVNAMADLTVHFVKRLYGEAIASVVERNFSHEIRRPYENTSYFEGSTKQRFEMSVRTFNRRFKNATGQTPLGYLQKVRIEIAKDLLQTSNLTVSEVADKIGYQDVGYFTSLFVKLLATSPREYRTTVRAKLFTAD